jgi:hypothetical protein
VYYSPKLVLEKQIEKLGFEESADEAEEKAELWKKVP